MNNSNNIVNFALDAWGEITDGQWELRFTVDPEGHLCGILREEFDDPEQYVRIRSRQMDIVELPDGTRRTVRTIIADEPFAGSVEVQQGYLPPDGFVPTLVDENCIPLPSAENAPEGVEA